MDICEILKTLSLKADLTQQEAQFFMSELLEGRLSEGQIGALLMGLKIKGESITEIAAFALEMRKKSVDMSIPEVDVIDTCGTGGDGKNTFNISTASAIIAAGAGCHVAKHGNRSVSSQCGSADVLEQLGITIQNSTDKIKEMITSLGIGFLFAPDMHLSMKNVMPVRKSLKMKTVFNILGPLTNPARAKKQIIGVYDLRLCEIYAQVLKEMGHEEAYIVHGTDGLDEVTISDATTVYHLKRGDIQSYEITPEKFGIQRMPLEAVVGGDASRNAEIIREVLEGKLSPARDIACLNASFAIMLSGKSANLFSGYQLACESIDSGKAMGILTKWQNFK